MFKDDGRLTNEQTRAIVGGKGASRLRTNGLSMMDLTDAQPEYTSGQYQKNQAQLHAIESACSSITSITQTIIQTLGAGGADTPWGTKIGGEGQTLATFAKALGVAPAHIGGDGEPLGQVGLEKMSASLTGKVMEMHGMVGQVQAKVANEGRISGGTTALLEQVQHSVLDLSRAFGLQTGR